jgi:uncharacterized protein (DUF1330 family)
MSFTLCVLLWANPGHERALAEYEDRVLALLHDHGAELLKRVRSSGEEGHPLEVQLIRLPSDGALFSYLADPRRKALTAARDAAVARTEMMRVIDV